MDNNHCNSKFSMSTHCVPGSVLSTVHEFSHFHKNPIVTFASQTRKPKQREVPCQGHKLRSEMLMERRRLEREGGEAGMWCFK